MSFDYFSKNKVQYILTKLKLILDGKAVPSDIKNGTLTIQKNGTQVQTFSANQSNNATANITVPTKTSELTNDSGFITNAGVTGAKGNSESTYRTGNVNITAANIGLGNVGNFKAVSTVASQGLTDTEKSNARTNIGAGTSSFSGNYNDLSNKPTIPTVNNGTLTIQKNGTNVQTFTANQSGNATANITVPTKVSELTNDSGYTTNVGTITGIKMNGASKGTSGVVDLGTVITAHQDISGKANTADLGDGAYKNSGVYYGTCATAAATKDKVVSVSADQKFTLKVGAVVHVKFTYSNTYSATADNKITLNVNSTGAKNIYYGTGYPTGTNTVAFGAANYIMSYMYNGTDWVWIGFSGENNTTYSVMSTSEGTTGTATTARTMSAANLKAIIDARGYTSNTGTVTSVATGVGLTGGTITGSGTIKAKLKSETASTLDSTAMGSTASRQYAVGVDKSGYLSVNIPWTDTNTDTKNTAGSTDTSSKIFLIGATSQAANPQTYSHDTAYVGTDGCLYSGGTKVLTSHQDISGKADKSATVSTVAWDSTNKKITKTINGTTSDVVTAATILGNLTKAQVTTALGYTPPTSDTNTHRPIQVNGTEILGNNTTALNLKAGSNVSISNSSGTVTIAATDTNNRKSFYGTCSTAAATKDKVVTLAESAGWPGLVAGVIVGVKFTNTNSYSNATASPITLNVNNTGAKNIWYANNHSGAGNTGTNTTAYGRANYINYYMYDGTYWVWLSSSTDNNTDVKPSAYCDTAAGTAAKVASCSGYVLLANSYIHVVIVNTNTYAGAITLNINGKGAKPIYINGAASSSSNYALTAGSYLVFYNGTNYYFRKDGKITTAGLVNTSNTAYKLTDENVLQNAIGADNYYPILFSEGTQTSGNYTGSTGFNERLLYNANSGSIKAIPIKASGDSLDNREVLRIFSTDIDVSEDNNNVSANQWHTISAYDKNDRRYANLHFAVEPDGDLSVQFSTVKYNNDGTIKGQNTLSIGVKNDGSAYYSFNKSAFCSALGISAWQHTLTPNSTNLSSDATTCWRTDHFVVVNINCKLKANLAAWGSNTIYTNAPQPAAAMEVPVSIQSGTITLPQAITITMNATSIILKSRGGSITVNSDTWIRCQYVYFC